ncbi:MAG: aminotransferase class V-fold PLP-dependent enzyme [Nitrospirae bacterium]|nr:aminotransferase class V-fold PLP-dependent enzyme [Nitrospirota bacterium]
MRKVYLDNAATTQPHLKVVEAMQPYFTEVFGNPLSLHSYGQAAKKAIDEAREKIAKLINAKPSEIIFYRGLWQSLKPSFIRPGSKKGNRRGKRKDCQAYKCKTL